MKKTQIVTKPICKAIIEKNKKGKLCGSVLLEEENYCPKHTDYEEINTELWSWTCKFIISQSQGKDRSRSRKGLECGDICEENKLYCKLHLKSKNIVDTKIINEEGELIWENEKVVSDVIRTFKVRAILNKEQRSIYAKLTGDCRKTWNQLVSVQNDIKDVSNFKLRDDFVTNKNIKPELSYLKYTPKDCRASVITEFVTSRDNCIKAYHKKIISRDMYIEKCKKEEIDYKVKTIKKPILKFKRKKDKQSIGISKSTVTPNDLSISLYTSIFKEPIRLHPRCKKDKKYKNFKKEGIKHDIRLLKTKTGKFYFAIPYDVKIKNTEKEYEFGSCDPGVKTFMTTFNDKGEINTFGEGCDLKIRKMHNIISCLKSRLKKSNNKYNIQKKIYLLEEKLKNKVTDLHFNVIKFLIKHKIFYLPKFNSVEMCGSTKTPKCTKREMNALSHYQFTLKAKSKSEEVGCELYISNEFRTTKTCGSCLRMNHGIGISRVFWCDYCHYQADRDENAARNNVLKYINS